MWLRRLKTGRLVKRRLAGIRVVAHTDAGVVDVVLATSPDFRFCGSSHLP